VTVYSRKAICGSPHYEPETSVFYQHAAHKSGSNLKKN
jgi:hypothetical protein